MIPLPAAQQGVQREGLRPETADIHWEQEGD